MLQLPTVPQYLLESSICMIVFFSLYYWLFKKETYHNFNRCYLLSASILSVLIPLIDIDSLGVVDFASQTIEPLIQYKAEANHFTSSIISKQFYQIAVSDVIIGIYYIGIFLFALKFLHITFQLMDNIKKRKKLTKNIHPKVKASGFSLFSHLYWTDEDDRDYTRKMSKEKGLKNIKSWHALDVILMEIIVIINWFNPLIYLFRNNFYKTHAYIADEHMSKNDTSKSDYIEKISSACKDVNYADPNSDYLPLINRVMMLSRKPSNTIAKLKPLLYVPAMLFLMTLFSFDYVDNISEEVKAGLYSIENEINETSEFVLLNLTHSKRNYEWEFKWGGHIFGLTSKDENGNLQYNMSKEISLYDLYESIESKPSYKTKGIYESMGFDIKITSNSDTVSNISVPIGEYENLNEMMKKEIVKHKTPFNIYLSNIGSSEGKRNGGFMVTVYQFMKSVDTEDQDEVRKIEATWGELDLQGSDFGWVISSNFRQMYGRWNRLRYSEKPNNIDKEDFLAKINLNFALKVNGEEITDKESTLLTLNIVRPEIVRKDEPSFSNKDKSPSSTIGSYKNTIYHGRSIAMVQDEYDFRDLLDSGENYLKDVLSTVTDGDVITIAAIDTLDESESGNHFFFNMTIQDVDAAYMSPYEVELPPSSDTYSNFQIYYNAEEDQTYVKVDTTASNNEKIVRAYRHSESYKLTHVPDFKTKNRINDTRVLPGGTLNVDPKMELSTSVLKMESLNEHYTLSDKMIRLDWGRMISIPDIGNFSRKEFKRSNRSNILLSAGDNFIDVSRFDLVIIKEGREPTRIRTDNIKSDLCRQALREIYGEVSIYFDNIIINDNDEYKYYPYQFVFNIE